MTDPERISKRSNGLSGDLLRAGAAEQPSEQSIEQTLTALGVAGVVLTTTTATSAAAGGAKLTGVATASVGAGGAGIAAGAGGTAKAVSATLLVKWIGIGVVSGVGIAGAAAVVTGPSATKQAIVAPSVVAPRVVVAAAPVATEAAPPSVSPEPPAPEVAPAAAMPAPRVSVALPAPELGESEQGVPLAAEVAFVDRARALLAAGQAEQGLSMLQGYEGRFPEARLLPEVLFLRLETCQRLGRTAEARASAQRLVDSFPKSPHASQARKLLSH
jgi:hypothetical protein